MTVAWRTLVVAMLVGYLATGVYFVGADEQGVVRRCGRVVAPLAEPGAHLGLPWPFDRVERVKTGEVKRLAITFAGGAETAAGAGPQYLTGDRNLVNVRATVQYTIANPAQYLWTAVRVEAVVGALAESTLAELLASSPVDRVLTLGKRELGVQSALQLQTAVDALALGIAIRSVDIGAVEPPAEVADAFERVTSALREREQVEHQARGFADRTVALAQAAAQQSVDQAKAHREQMVQAAHGEAERFAKLSQQYHRAPQLTAQRLYLETISDVLPRLKSKLVLGSKSPLDLGLQREEKK